MKLFLTSRAVHPNTLQKLDEYVHGISGKSIAYIPTAANGDGYGHWKEGESWRTVQTLGASLSLIELEQFRSKDVLKDLLGKDIIWVAGGECGYLMYWMRRCEIDTHIHEILEKSLYVGSSAGSMVTAPTLHVAEWYPTDKEIGAATIPGLGLVDFDIYPHFTDDQMDYVKDHSESKKIYLLKDGEEIIVEDNTVTVVGEERIL